MFNLKILLISIGLFFHINSNAMEKVKLCLTGKIELSLPSYKSTALNSVDLALNKSKYKDNVIVKNYFYDSDPLSPLRTYEKMVDDQCSAIIGFEYLNDLMLVAKSQKNTNIPIFTSYSSSKDIDKLPENIFIFMPSYDYQANKMMNFLTKKFGKINNVLLITEANRIDLVKYKESYENLLNKNKTIFDKFYFLQNESRLEEKLEKFVTGKNYDFVFLFSGAVGSTKIVNYMNDHKIKFIGTENFGSSTNQSLYIRLNDKLVSAFSVRNLDFLKSNKEQEEFLKNYSQKYNSTPVQLGMYSYDSVNIILKTLEKENSLSVNNILKINFNGITGAYIKNNKFYRSNNYVILSISKKGFILEE